MYRRTFKKLKELVKISLRNSKIVRSNFLQPPLNFDIKIQNYKLDEQQCDAFERFEKHFRKSIASKDINVGDFRCNGDVTFWINIAKTLSGVFIKLGSFLYKPNKTGRWSVPFLKYCKRVLKKFPVDKIVVNDLSDIEGIKYMLQYINSVIVPFFVKRSVRDDESVVSREKLTILWIKFVISCDFNPNRERYFRSEDVIIQNSELFSIKEIEVQVKSCPNGKACGVDGVYYEDIKTNWEDIGDIIKDIFNLILINLKVPESWKESVVQRIPKKNFDRTDMSTLRDISLMPTIYKIFSKCICERIKPFIILAKSVILPTEIDKI